MHVARLLFSLFVLAGLFTTNALAQRDFDPLAPGSLYEVSGQVRSADNKTVENAMVKLETHSGALVDQGTTDSMGRFRFTRLRSGTYKVSATTGNAVPQSQVVDINRGNPRPHLLFQLVPEPLPNATPPARVG